MARIGAVGAAVAVAAALAATPARAGFGVAASVGTGLVAKEGVSRVPTNLEVMPFYKIAIFAADLGLRFNLESPRDLILRPGGRLDLKLLYLRVAVPVQVTGESDVGFLFGLGTSFGVGPVGIFLEADMNLTRNLGWSQVPIEFRAGVQFGF